MLQRFTGYRQLTSATCWLLASICWLAASCCHAGEPVVIGIDADILPDYITFVNHRDLTKIQHYKGAGARRDVIELVLLQQAVAIGGFKHPIEIKAGRSYRRTLRDVAEGNFIASGNLGWKEDITPLGKDILISRPVVRSGEFVAGIYTSTHNPKALAADNLAALTKLTAVTSSQWTADVRILNQLGFTQIIYSPNWINIVRMIEAGRADITLAPFQQNEGMLVEIGDIKLVPIKGIKIAFAGSRHWSVSRKHPQGQAFYDAMERGLTYMEAHGIIQQAYLECGFFHPDVATWTVLNPPDLTP